MSDRPANACLTHRPPKPGRPWRLADQGYTTCSGCVAKLRSWLLPGSVDDDNRPTSIPDLYASLDTEPVVTDSGRRGPGFASRSPASEHVIAMTDRRSKSHEVGRDGIEYVWDPKADHGRRLPPGVYGPEEPPGAYIDKRDVWFGSDGKPYRESETPVRSVPFTLAALAGLVTEERELTEAPPSDVTGLALFLERHLDWLTRQDWVADVHDDLQTLHRQLKAATGDGGDPPVGSCIEPVEGGECGAAIYMPAGTRPRAPDEPIRDLPSLQCQACGATYDGRRLILLRLANERKTA